MTISSIRLTTVSMATVREIESRINSFQSAKDFFPFFTKSSYLHLEGGSRAIVKIHSFKSKGE
jgi:hypothetical protein